MIHFKSADMSRVACLAVSAQASSDRPAAVDCPDCKANPAVVLMRALDGLSGTLAAQDGSGIVRDGSGGSELSAELSACLPGIVKDDRR